MGFLAAVILVLIGAAVIVAEVAARLTARHERLRSAGATVFAAAALVPLLGHMSRTMAYARNSPGTGTHPSLAAFRGATLTLVAVAALVAVAIIAGTARRPLARLVVTPLPLVAFYVYFRTILPLARHSEYGLVFYDNVPNVWLFLLMAAGSFALFVYLVRVTVRSGELDDG